MEIKFNLDKWLAEHAFFTKTIIVLFILIVLLLVLGAVFGRIKFNLWGAEVTPTLPTNAQSNNHSIIVSPTSQKKGEKPCNMEVIELKALIDSSITFMLLPKHYDALKNKQNKNAKEIETKIIKLNVIRYSELIQEKKACDENKITQDFSVLKSKITSIIEK